MKIWVSKRLALTTMMSALVGLLVTAALDPIAFRLDDVQCGYKQAHSIAIMDAFLRHSVPLTIGLITAPPLNYMQNWDCHVPDLLVRKANFASAGVSFEFASHSVSHDVLTSMTPDQQFVQLNASKVHIEAKFSTKVVTFLPPQNMWNADSITQAVAAGYKIWSGQCGAGQMQTDSPDGSCIVNMRPDITPSFFNPIDGIIHAPVGLSISNARSGVCLEVDQLMADTTACEPQYCSIKSQMNGNIGHTVSGRAWSIVMMHPQDFPNITALDAFYDEFLPRVKALYSVYTIRELVSLVSGTQVNDSSTTFSSSSSSSSTIGSSSSSTASTTFSSSSSSTGSIDTSSSSSGTGSTNTITTSSSSSSGDAFSGVDMSGGLTTASHSTIILIATAILAATLSHL